MARIIRCDRCKREAEPDEHGLPPEGWITITVRTKVFSKPIEVCGEICGIAQLRQRDPHVQ